MQTGPNYNSAAVNNLNLNKLGLISLLCILKDIYYFRTLGKKNWELSVSNQKNFLSNRLAKKRCPCLLAIYICKLQKFKINILKKSKILKHTVVYTKPKKN